jgi:hypothetical protein
VGSRTAQYPSAPVECAIIPMTQIAHTSKRSNIQQSPFRACDRRGERQRKVQQNRGEELRSGGILSMSSTSGRRRQIRCNVWFGDLDVLRGIQVVLSLEITRTQALRQAALVSGSANVVLRMKESKWRVCTESCQRGMPCVSCGQSGSLTATTCCRPCISAVDTHMPGQTHWSVPCVTLQQTLSEDGGPPSALLCS